MNTLYSKKILTLIGFFILSLSAPNGAEAVTSPATTEFIVVDQFGYRPGDEKIAVIRDPLTGADAEKSFSPDPVYTLIDSQTSAVKYQSAIVAWNDAKEDVSSGDRVWRFDFSSVTTPGKYYVFDTANNVRSPIFDIRKNVYNVVLAQALRTFFYKT